MNNAAAAAENSEKRARVFVSAFGSFVPEIGNVDSPERFVDARGKERRSDWF